MQLHSSETLINSRYQLHQILGQGGMGVVYSCTDRMTDVKIALKRVLATKPPADATLPVSPDILPMLTAQFEEEHSEGIIRLALSQEFETLASLRHPHIISVLDYGFDEQKQPFFTMPLLQDALTITEAAQNQSLARKVQLIGEMLQALSYLHHRGIVHRDLKPDNVLVASDMRVKVLDFGLATLREGQDVDDEVAGTIPYMAPEVLRGEAANPSADIFAAGLIAYEILAGHYPFSDKNTNQIIMAILMESPDFDELDVSQELRTTLERMLERDSEERYLDAHIALLHLRGTHESNLLKESEESRESYLRAARFVGRDSELGELNNSLFDATKGHGSSWLIGGESGVGKSRLIDELRVRALVSGVTVLRGQAASGEGLAFQVWREPIRRLLLMSKLDDQECSILKTLIPDIERLLQRPIPDVETRGSTTYLDQLNTVIVKLFRSQNQPILLILEDLQWAAESLDVLDMLNTIVGHLRLLIVGTYQDDERASLPEKLPSMDLMKLERFSKENIKELSGTLLGEEQQTDLVDLLFKETEGNVQFVIEVIRSLAQEAGGFHQISSMELPKEVTAGGIQRILQRRLENLEDTDFSLLRACAVIGREINEALLTQLIQGQEQAYNIEDWLAKCLNRRIFDLHNGTWRFSHDRLRTNVILQGLDSDETAKLHERVAKVIEQVYPDAPEHYAKLQYHWGQAGIGNLELKYAIAAGDYAMKLNMFMDARRHYERAYELLNKLDNATTTAFSAEILLKLGEAQFRTSYFEESQENLENALVLLNKDKRPLEVAQAYYYLANALWRQSDYEAARIAGQNSLELATEHHDERLMANALTRLGQVAFEQGDYSSARQYYEQGLIHAMNSGDGEAQAALYNNIGIIEVESGDYKGSLQYFEQSIQISRERGAQHRVVSTLQNLGAVAGMREDFDKSLQYFEQSLELARNIGDRRRVGQILGNLGFLSNLMKDFERAREYLMDSLELARSIGNRRDIAAQFYNLGLVESDVQDFAQAQCYFVDCLKEAFEIEALPYVMDSLFELARIEDDKHMALIWLEKVFSHTATKKETFGKTEALIEELRQVLGEDVVETQLKVGANMELKKVVEVVINGTSLDEK